MTVNIFLSTDFAPETTGAYDHVIGLDPTTLNLAVHHNLGLLGTGAAPLPDAVLTFLMAGIGIWAADKIAPRSQAPDAWTRRLHLSGPAGDWAAALPPLAPLLNFLTGDDWTLTARPDPPRLTIPSRPELSWQPDCACLFSGGVDSLAGAIELLAAGRRVLLVSHYDFGQLAASQNLLADGLTRLYGPEQVRRWGFRIQFEAPELSLRSRSLLFIALGLAAASVWGRALPLFIPENGLISLNPPLTGNRLGSYSTRTTHPYFISGLQAFLVSTGIPANLINPYQYFTKGEMLARSPNPGLLRTLLPASLSCAHPVAFRWHKNRQGNCGYCFPCLLRRAPLQAVGWDDGQEYAFDIWQQPEILTSRARGADLRSLLYLLHQWRRAPQPQQLLCQTGPIPGGQEERLRLAAMLVRGLEEVNRWVEEKGAISGI